MATFRKNGKGEWVVFGTASEVKPGKVRVERKDRSVRTVTVSSVGRPFMANGQMMVYGYIEEKKAEEPKPAPEVEVDPEVAAEVAAELAAELAAEQAASCDDMLF